MAHLSCWSSWQRCCSSRGENRASRTAILTETSRFRRLGMLLLSRAQSILSQPNLAGRSRHLTFVHRIACITNRVPRHSAAAASFVRRSSLPLARTASIKAHRSKSLAVSSNKMDPAWTSETFFLDEFAQRQWDDPNYSGTRISFDKADFVARVQKAYEEGGKQLVPGYAPFCKHVIVPNFVGAKVGCLEITDENKDLLRCGYSRRRADELAVLTRWFPESLVEVPEAKMLDVILYSREQLIQEYRARLERQGDKVEDPDLPPSPWGIISIKAQDEAFETPMQPITMMRNALGKEEGGSGVPLEREKYEESTAYWQNHAPIVAGDMPSGD